MVLGKAIALRVCKTDVLMMWTLFKYDKKDFRFKSLPNCPFDTCGGDGDDLAVFSAGAPGKGVLW